MSEMHQIPKRKLNLVVENLRPLQADELELVNGAKSTESAAGSMVASAASGAGVSALIAESTSACPLVGGVASAIGSALSQWFGCW